MQGNVSVKSSATLPHPRTLMQSSLPEKWRVITLERSQPDRHRYLHGAHTHSRHCIVVSENGETTSLGACSHQPSKLWWPGSLLQPKPRPLSFTTTILTLKLQPSLCLRSAQLAESRYLASAPPKSPWQDPSGSEASQRSGRWTGERECSSGNVIPEALDHHCCSVVSDKDTVSVPMLSSCTYKLLRL